MKDTPLEIRVERAEGACTVRVSGDVTASRAGDLEDAVLPLVETGTPLIDLDLAAMTFLSSTGLAVLVRLNRQARQAKLRINLLSPGPSIKRMLHIAGLPIG